MGKMKEIGVIGTGGTISSLSADRMDVLDYPDYGEKLHVSALLERFSLASRFAELTPIEFPAVSSAKIGPKEWCEIANLIASNADKFDGFVVTHGTGTLEETAFFLHLVLATEKPVVLVGAQRPASAVSSDAEMNFVSAVRVAVHPYAAGAGVLVVLNDEVHSARDVVKTSTYRLQTFQSPDFGPIGTVDGDGVKLFRSVNRCHTTRSRFSGWTSDKLPRVDIVYAYAGSDGVAVDAFIEAGARGLISAGFAPGLTTLDEAVALERAIARNVLIVQSSRAGSGRVAQRTRLKELGIVGAGNLNPQKSRILLSMALTQTTVPDEIQKIFDEY